MKTFENRYKANINDIGQQLYCWDTSYMICLNTGEDVSLNKEIRPFKKLVKIISNSFKMKHSPPMLGELEHEFVIIEYNNQLFLAINDYFRK